MSQYECLECENKTAVIDSRPFHDRIRRRRKCPHGHRFSTIEVPASAQDEIKALVIWAFGQNRDDTDVVAYMEAKADHIFLGLPDPDDPDEPDEPAELNTEP